MKLELQEIRKLLLFGYVLLFLNNINAQTIQSPKDVVYLNYLTTGNADFNEINGALLQEIIDVKINTPTISIGEKLQLNNVFDSKINFSSGNNLNNSLVQLPENLYEFRYTLFARHTLSDAWKMIYIPRLIARSDFASSGFGSDLLFPQLIAIALKSSTKNQALSWGFGINYNNNQGKNSILPVVAISYSKPNMKINARLPQSANITFIRSEKFEYGFSLNLEGSITNLQNEQYSEEAAYLKRQDIYIFPNISTNVRSNLWLNLKGGLIINNSYSFVDDDYEVADKMFENSLKPSFFIQLGISYRLNE